MENKLPNNWVSLPFTEIFDINGGTQPPKAVFIDEPKEGYVRLLQIRDFGKKPVPTYIPDTGKLMTCQKDDILIARYGASIGRIVTGMEGSYNVALAKVSIPEKMNKNFVKWLLKSHLFQEPILSIQRTAQNGFNKTDLAAIFVPLPPLAEQNRIVEKLDRLFAQLEILKTSMVKVPELLKDFRQQVLTQAVTGKLTEEWRSGKELDSLKDLELIKKNKKVLIKDGFFKKSKLEPIKNEELILKMKPSEWESCVFDEVFRFIDYRGKTPTRTSDGVRLITAKNIKMGSLSEHPIEFIDAKQYDTWMTRGLPIYGDIFFVTEGHTMGNVALNNRIDKFVLAQRTLTLQSFSEISNGFFYYLIMSEKFQVIIDDNATGTAAKGIKAAKFKNLPILFPSVLEQQEIVRRVESLFAKADAIEQQYKTLKASIDNLPQALLHKAFKGELSEQLDTDGDARELLKQIQELKNNTVKAKKVTTKKTKNYPEGDGVLGMVAEENVEYKK